MLVILYYAELPDEFISIGEFNFIGGGDLLNKIKFILNVIAEFIFKQEGI